MLPRCSVLFPCLLAGRYRETIPAAVQCFFKSVETNPSNHVAWYLLGRCYMATSQYADACEAYNRAVNLNPNDPQVLHVMPCYPQFVFYLSCSGNHFADADLYLLTTHRLAVTTPAFSCGRYAITANARFIAFAVLLRLLILLHDDCGCAGVVLSGSALLCLRAVPGGAGHALSCTAARCPHG